jgi:hypothetical protein
MTYKFEERMIWITLFLTILAFAACAPRIEQQARPLPADRTAQPMDRYCLLGVNYLQPNETGLMYDPATGRTSVVCYACEVWNGNEECRYLVWPLGTRQDPTLARGYRSAADFLTDGAQLFGVR